MTSDEEDRYIVRYLELCVEQMGLPFYTFYINDAPSGEDQAACIEVMTGYEAQVSLHEDFSTYSRDFKRQVLWHEAAHLLLRQLNDEIDNLFDSAWASHEVKMHSRRILFRTNELLTQQLENMMRRMGAFPVWPRKGVERLPLRR